MRLSITLLLVCSVFLSAETRFEKFKRKVEAKNPAALVVKLKSKYLEKIDRLIDGKYSVLPEGKTTVLFVCSVKKFKKHLLSLEDADLIHDDERIYEYGNRLSTSACKLLNVDKYLLVFLESSEHGLSEKEFAKFNYSNIPVYSVLAGKKGAKELIKRSNPGQLVIDASAPVVDSAVVGMAHRPQGGSPGNQTNLKHASNKKKRVRRVVESDSEDDEAPERPIILQRTGEAGDVSGRAVVYDESSDLVLTTGVSLPASTAFDFSALEDDRDGFAPTYSYAEGEDGVGVEMPFMAPVDDVVISPVVPATDFRLSDYDFGQRFIPQLFKGLHQKIFLHCQSLAISCSEVYCVQDGPGSKRYKVIDSCGFRVGLAARDYKPAFFVYVPLDFLLSERFDATWTQKIQPAIPENAWVCVVYSQGPERRTTDQIVIIDRNINEKKIKFSFSLYPVKNILDRKNSFSVDFKNFIQARCRKRS